MVSEVTPRLGRPPAGADRRRRLVVVALGGNALLRRGQAPEIEIQRDNMATAVRSIAALARDNDIVVTHGNGPQVGLLARQSVADSSLGPYPLDVLDAESEGMIGYMLEQGLRNALPDREVVTLLTQVVVDAADPAFARPTKPIGPVYSEAEARRLAALYGWTIARDGLHFRRVVSSPQPLEIVELETVQRLVADGAIVICVGGGGIPVRRRADGALEGVEAVIDKDLSAALLGRLLAADVLLMLTDVAAVQSDWGTERAQAIRTAHQGELDARAFAAGSMGPKIAAANLFVSQTGGVAAIGALADAGAILRGEAGTLIEG